MCYSYYMKQDERDIIAEEFVKMYERIRKRMKSDGDGYIDYLVFCLTGGHILEDDEARFFTYIAEIINKKS